MKHLLLLFVDKINHYLRYDKTKKKGNFDLKNENKDPRKIDHHEIDDDFDQIHH